MGHIEEMEGTGTKVMSMTVDDFDVSFEAPVEVRFWVMFFFFFFNMKRVGLIRSVGPPRSWQVHTICTQ